MFAFARWNLILGRSNACVSALQAQLKDTRADATAENDRCEELAFEDGGFILPLGVGEGVTKFVLVTLLGIKGVSRFIC